MNIQTSINIAIAGQFQLQRIKAESGEVVEDTGWFDNLVLDQGIFRSLSGNTVGAYVQVGSSNAPVSVGQTALSNFVATISTLIARSSSAQPTPPYYGTVISTWQSGVGEAAGVLAEIGVGWLPEAGLFSRALIVDADGNPTTITVLSDEVLVVRYAMRMYPPLVDQVTNFTLNGDDYVSTIRAANVTSGGADGWGAFSPSPLQVSIIGDGTFTGTIGNITQAPNGTYLATTYGGLLAYVPNTFSRTMRTTIPINDSNGLIRSRIMYSTYGAFQQQFTPGILKTSSDVMTLENTFFLGRVA